jgi:hypothetical protein
MDAGGLGAHLEHPGIPENDEARQRPDIRLGQELGQQFRADAGRIAHGDRNRRQAAFCDSHEVPYPAVSHSPPALHSCMLHATCGY